MKTKEYLRLYSMKVHGIAGVDATTLWVPEKTALEAVEMVRKEERLKAIKAYCANCKTYDIGYNLSCAGEADNCPFIGGFINELNKE